MDKKITIVTPAKHEFIVSVDELLIATGFALGEPEGEGGWKIFHFAITSFSHWQKTPQGHDFWSEQADRVRQKKQVSKEARDALVLMAKRAVRRL